MSLQSLPDRFDAATHDELDRNVNKDVSDLFSDGPLVSPIGHCFLLSLIVHHSKGDLDSEYCRNSAAGALIDAHEELKEMLSSAWEKKSYRDIRNLAILKPPQAVPEPPPSFNYEQHRLSLFFKEKYLGTAVDGFYEYLTYNEKLFRTAHNPQYYAKFCSIVQSSGTGKSRMMTETMTIPLRDPIPCKILTELPSAAGEYMHVCSVFFAALFDTVEEHLSTCHATEDAKAGAMLWARKMCDMSDTNTVRMDFFDKVAKKYKDSDSTVSLLTSYAKMGASLEKIFAGEPDKPKLVIALDDADLLVMEEWARNFYRPTDALCRVVNMYSHYDEHAVWVVFATKACKTTLPVLPSVALFPSYTQLGWDQRAFPLGDVSAEDVSRIGHIIHYGRPLWVSLGKNFSVPYKLLKTASFKLCGDGYFDQRSTGHVLAVLGQRFGLNVTLGHRDSAKYLESGMANHLRVCHATTLDRNWSFTSYPSEPYLSCVAARLLHIQPGTLEGALYELMRSVRSGIIDIGQGGELASRLLWLLAKDLFVRTQANIINNFPSTWEGVLPDCQMIPVVNWLSFVFGPQVWECTQASVARGAFEDAYLDFSHWICMEANMARSRGDESSLNDWTLRHWQRTSAVQCYQETLDKVVPIYFKGGPEGASARSRMSQILISDKARESKLSKRALQTATDREGESDSKASFLSLPYIATLAELGRPPSFSITFDTDDQCLRIDAAGVDTATYPFLTNYPALKQALQDLIHLQQVPETETPFLRDLNAQLKFGSTTSSEHMEWGQGRTVTAEKKNVSG